MKRREVSARKLTPEMLQALAAGLKPLTRDESALVKGNEREAIIAFSCPAYGRLPKHSIRLVRAAAKQRGLETITPGALRVLKNENLLGYLVLEPVVTYDSAASDQYQLRWERGGRVAYVEMLSLLQPRNMAVPKGFVSEIPLSMETLPTGTHPVLILHLTDAVMREVESTQPASASEQP